VRRDETSARTSTSGEAREWTRKQLAAICWTGLRRSARRCSWRALARKATKKELAALRELLDDYRTEKNEATGGFANSPLAGATGWRCCTRCGRAR